MTRMAKSERTRESFGVALRAAREKRMLGLREFCRKAALDPALVSRIERGLALPPTDAKTLRSFARGLGLSLGSAQWRDLADLAAVTKGELPQDLLRDPKIASRLPVLFRALRDVKSDRKLLDELQKILRKS